MVSAAPSSVAVKNRPHNRFLIFATFAPEIRPNPALDKGAVVVAPGI